MNIPLIPEFRLLFSSVQAWDVDLVIYGNVDLVIYGNEDQL